MAVISFEGLGLSVEDVEAIRDAAISNLKTSMVITSWSVGESSTSKQFSAPTEDVLAACRAFLQGHAPQKYGPRINRTLADFS